MFDMNQYKFRQKYKTSNKMALKSFIFLFTAQCHQSINQSLKKNAYGKLILVIAAVLKELHQYNSEYGNILKFSSQNQNQKFTLFRGINCYDESMIPGKNLFWKGFTSTSKNLSVAEKFGNNIYCVNIKNNSHPYIVVPKNLSAYEGEEEVILFPYFSFKVNSVKEETCRVVYMLESNIFND